MLKKHIGAGVLALGLLFSVGFVAPPAQAAGLTSTQVSAILSLLSSFGADQGTISSVSAALGGSTTAGVSCSSFADVHYGDFDNDSGGRVSQLQTFLGIASNTFGFGTYGKKTQAAWNAQCGGTTSTQNSSTGLTVSSNYGAAPLTVTFSNLPVTAAEENLNFGDGQSTSNGATGYWPSGGVVHTYTTPGTYTVTLLGEMSEGQLGSATITVTGSNSTQSSAMPTCTLTPSAYTPSLYTSVPGQIYVKLNSSVTFTWASQNATSGMWSSGDKAGTSGSTTFNNLTQSTNNYSITFTGPGGSTTCGATIYVDLKG